ncbi:MAG TPA: AMP-binding protein [Streptosporangiaceae bacterium]|nr:AMP-binding protein [Streptosporangiaceae bacterium]
MGGYQDWSVAGWREHLPGVADVRSFAAQLGEDTIPGLAAASAAAVPGRVAVTVDGEPVTHADLDDAAARVAGWLARRVRPGDRVLLAAAASAGFVRCYLGALRAGAVVVLANPGYTTAELGHLVADSGAVLAFADPGPARLLAALGPGGDPLETVDIRTLPGGSSQGTGVTARPDDTALLAYTSGTTGRPKGVPLTHRQLAVSIRSAMAAWRWNQDDVLAHALPLYHQHGLGGVHAALVAGGTVHVRSRFTPADLARTIADTGASALFAVPTIYQALVDSGEVTAARFGGLRLAVCGSAPLSPALAERLTEVLGRVPLIRYGTTETGLNVSNPLDDPRGDTVGVPLPGVLARIAAADGEADPGSDREADLGADGEADPGSDREADLGADGEIQLRGPQVFAGYWRDRAATQAAFTPDGWFRTGDIGAVDPATGHLRIRGRIKEMIITGGLNVYPREVEIVLEAHPSVAEAAVAGVPHERWGEQVTAWVVVRDGHGFDEAALIAHARTRLAGYKCPKRVFRLAALPRNAVGKIVRSVLG